eukprot:3678160-Rhodomonas_salina.1
MFIDGLIKAWGKEEGTAVLTSGMQLLGPIVCPVQYAATRLYGMSGTELGSAVVPGEAICGESFGVSSYAMLLYCCAHVLLCYYARPGTVAGTDV